MPAPTPYNSRQMNDIVVEPKKVEVDVNSQRQESLVKWVLAHVERWEEYRNNNYEELWNEYYRMWKGVWTNSERTRKSERSKFISPALQQAIEMGVAEAEEATFGRNRWIDIEDDLRDEQKADMVLIRDQLLEDMELYGVPDNVSEVYLNAAIYGTGI